MTFQSFCTRHCDDSRTLRFDYELIDQPLELKTHFSISFLKVNNFDHAVRRREFALSFGGFSYPKPLYGDVCLWRVCANGACFQQDLERADTPIW